tara:strand:+ start:3024 stop:4397 length:1374 start_codon:yes stop_codon:yes gene_type:complete
MNTDLITLSTNSKTKDSSNFSKYNQLNSFDNWKKTLLNDWECKFNINDTIYTSIDQFYYYVLNLYPEFKITDIFDVSKHSQIPYKLMALALYSKFTQNPEIGLFLVLTKDSKLYYEINKDIFQFKLLEYIRTCIIKCKNVIFDSEFINKLMNNGKDNTVFGFKKNNKLIEYLNSINCEKESISPEYFSYINNQLINFKILFSNDSIISIVDNYTNKNYIFDIGKKLGNEGYEGVTFSAVLRENGKNYAIKTFDKTHNKKTDKKDYNELVKEASLQYIASLKGVAPKVFAIIFNKNIKGIIMEKLDYSLRQVLEYNKGILSKYQELSLVECVIKLSEICILHHDNNPLNFMWSVEKNKFYYIDFGFSIFLSEYKGKKNLFHNLAILKDCFEGFRLGLFKRKRVNSKGIKINIPASANRQWWDSSFIKEITILASNKIISNKRKIIKLYNEFKNEVLTE